MSVYLEKGTTATVNPPRGQTILGVNSGITQNTQILVIQPEVLAAYYNAQLLEDYESGVLTLLEYNTIITNQNTTRQLWEINTNYSQEKQPLIDLIENNNFPITTAGKTAPELTDDINTHGYQVVIIPTVTAIVPATTPYVNGTYQNFKVEATNTAIEFLAIDGSAEQVEHINTIEAVLNDDGIRIQLVGGGTVVVNKVKLDECYIDSVLVTQVLATAINELNSLFALTTGAIGKLPTITSGDILLTAGNPINYIVTGDNIASVDYDLTGLPANTLTTPLYNQFNLIGGTLLPVGNYTFTVHCFNYWGQTSKVINISVSSSYTNTYSYEGSSLSYFQKTDVGTENDTPLYRPTGATGSPWTIFSWMKSNSSSGAWKVVFWFGDYRSATGGTNAGTVYLLCRTYGGNIAFWFVYGDWSGNYVRSGQVFTGIAQNVWFSYQINYDGTSTNNSLATLPFSMYLNGVAISPSWAYGGTGYAGSIEYMPLLAYPDRSQFNLGRGNVYSTVVYAQNVFFDEMALWQSDESANASAFHNAGTPIDLASYNPYHYYRFGDGTPSDISTFPVMTNRGSIGTSGDLDMFNGHVGLFVSDVP